MFAWAKTIDSPAISAIGASLTDQDAFVLQESIKRFGLVVMNLDLRAWK